MSYQPRRKPWHEQRSLRGLRYHLTWWGEPSDSPLVLLHGFMDCGATWQFLVDCLPESCPCVALDWRGFGSTEWSAAGYWFPDYLADLEALLDLLVPHAPARVIGHSLGGNVAALYAGIRPKRLAWLASLEGLGPARMTPEKVPERYAEWLDGLRTRPPDPIQYQSRATLAAFLRMRNPGLTQEKAELIAESWTQPVDSGVRIAADPLHRRINPLFLRREEAEACWRLVEIPLLLLLGQDSKPRSQLGLDATNEYFQSTFRNARVLTVTRAGHMLHHEQPETVARHILEFAAETSAPLG